MSRTLHILDLDKTAIDTFTAGLFRKFLIDILLKRRDARAVTHRAEYNELLEKPNKHSMAIATNGYNAERAADALFTYGVSKERHNIASFATDIFRCSEPREPLLGLNPLFWEQQRASAKFNGVTAEGAVIDFLKELKSFGITEKQWGQLSTELAARRDSKGEAIPVGKGFHIIYNILKDNQIARAINPRVAAENVRNVIFVDDNLGYANAARQLIDFLPRAATILNKPELGEVQYIGGVHARVDGEIEPGRTYNRVCLLPPETKLEAIIDLPKVEREPAVDEGTKPPRIVPPWQRTTYLVPRNDGQNVDCYIIWDITNPEAKFEITAATSLDFSRDARSIVAIFPKRNESPIVVEQNFSSSPRIFLFGEEPVLKNGGGEIGARVASINFITEVRAELTKIGSMATSTIPLPETKPSISSASLVGTKGGPLATSSTSSSSSSSEKTSLLPKEKSAQSGCCCTCKIF